MRIGLCKRRAPVPPLRDIAAARTRREPELADYDTMRVESAALAHVVVERPENVTLPELTRELLITLPCSEGQVVERAVERMVAGGLLCIKDGTLLPGPVFGSAASTDYAPSNN